MQVLVRGRAISPPWFEIILAEQVYGENSVVRHRNDSK